MRAHMEMADLSMAVQRDLKRVDCGMITLMDAPAAGGRHWFARLVDVVLTDLEARYNIDPVMVQTILRQAVAEYEYEDEAMFGAVRWISQGLRFLVGIPVLLVRASVALLRRHYKLLALLASVLGTVAAVLTILQVLGRLF